MPYIILDKRKEIDALVETYGLALEAGDLNYVFTRIINNYFNNSDKRNYQAINDIIGALEGAKLEFYRRTVIPYENEKIKQNGDV